MDSKELAGLALTFGVPIVVGIGIFAGLGTIRAALLARTDWSLADALSEETTISEIGPDGKAIRDEQSAPLSVTVMKASSSRLIALIGLVSILMIYLGFGFAAVAHFAANGTFSTEEQASLDTAMKFVFAGVTMFAPYLVNKFASVFDWMTPKA